MYTYLYIFFFIKLASIHREFVFENSFVSISFENIETKFILFNEIFWTIALIYFVDKLQLIFSELQLMEFVR